jgi:hypothetical protein
MERVAVSTGDGAGAESSGSAEAVDSRRGGGRSRAPTTKPAHWRGRDFGRGAAPTNGIRRSTMQVVSRRGDEVEAAPPTKKKPGKKQGEELGGRVNEATVDRDGGQAVEAAPPRKKTAEATGRR